MHELLWVLSPLFFFGVPGLVGGVALGWWRKSWWAAAALVVAGFVLCVAGLSTIPDDPDDDDPGLAIAIGAAINLAGWILGLVVATALARRQPRHSR